MENHCFNWPFPICPCCYIWIITQTTARYLVLLLSLFFLCVSSSYSLPSQTNLLFKTTINIKMSIYLHLVESLWRKKMLEQSTRSLSLSLSLSLSAWSPFLSCTLWFFFFPNWCPMHWIYLEARSLPSFKRAKIQISLIFLSVVLMFVCLLVWDTCCVSPFTG